MVLKLCNTKFTISHRHKNRAKEKELCQSKVRPGVFIAYDYIKDYAATHITLKCRAQFFMTAQNIAAPVLCRRALPQRRLRLNMLRRTAPRHSARRG